MKNSVPRFDVRKGCSRHGIMATDGGSLYASLPARFAVNTSVASSTSGTKTNIAQNPLDFWDMHFRQTNVSRLQFFPCELVDTVSTNVTFFYYCFGFNAITPVGKNVFSFYISYFAFVLTESEGDCRTF